jgi:dolichol-phosphate mannosyltransferase
MRSVVIVPTYNEAENIHLLLTQLVEQVSDIEILVVDDNSSDETQHIVEHFQESSGVVHLLKRPLKTGLGDAYRDGFTWAIKNDFDVVVQMDADGSHRVIDLISLLKAISTSDVVIGSRWVQGGAIENWPRKRYWLSRLGNLYGRLMLRLSIHDATAGFRVYRKKAIDKAHILQSKSQGYVFQIENSLRITEANLRVTEVPITFVERTYGVSKMSSAIVKEAMMKVTAWGLQGRLLGRNLFIK